MRHAFQFVALFAIVAPALADPPEPKFARRWFYSMHNLQVDSAADELVGLIARAGEAGYNGVVVSDYKLNVLDRVPERYFENLERVRRAAEAAKVEIVPALFAVGYSSGLLAHDPNLAEGLPVVAAPFVAKGGEARPEGKGGSLLANGDFEAFRGDAFDGFAFQDEPGKGSFVDREVVHGGKAALRIQDAPGNARIMQSVAVRPHACYRISAWVKTRGARNAREFRLLALGGDGGRQLTFFEGGVEADQDWTLVEVVFNSLNQNNVNIYAGVWTKSPGTVWVDDLRVEELGLTNVLRREGCPLVVASADGQQTYEEGRDFEPVADPKLGRVPYAGVFDFAHDAPPIRLKAGSRIRDGQSLRVSWYHPILIHGSQVMCCLTDPGVDAILRDQARRVNAALKPRTVFFSHDEIRVANWCGLCQSTGKTPGALLADEVRRCRQILKEEIPEAGVVLWSDMFDPNHNAVDGYYLVNGTFRGSWEGLDPAMTLANWNEGKAAESLKFFADRGHRQILAGYYDANDLGNFRKWDHAAEGVPGIDGFLYTTWEGQYRLLGEYGRAMKN